MQKKLRITMVGCGALLVVVVALVVLYRGAQQVPRLYREAIRIDPVELREASDEMLSQAAALVSDVKKKGQWQSLFTARQINGWLAVDLVENHPNALPRSISDPRVAIRPDRIMLFCRFQRGNLQSVVTLTVEPSVPEPNVLAFRIRSARAGIVPVPLEKVLEAISQAAARTGFRLQWRQSGGDPVAMVTIPPPYDENEKLVRVESIRLGEDEIYLSGRTDAKVGR